MHSNFISHIKNYVPLDTAEQDLLLSLVKTISVKKKEYLLQEGNVCKANYFVENGCLRMFFINEKGIEQITHFALENWWLSDQMSLISQKPSGFYIQAIEPSQVISIGVKQEEEILKEIPQMERYFRIMIQRAYAASQNRLKFFHTFSKEESYQHFIKLFPEFTQRVPQYMLASYLGLTPEYLSELRKKV